MTDDWEPGIGSFQIKADSDAQDARTEGLRAPGLSAMADGCETCDGSGFLAGRVRIDEPGMGSEPGWVPCLDCERGQQAASLMPSAEQRDYKVRWARWKAEQHLRSGSPAPEGGE